MLFKVEKCVVMHIGTNNKLYSYNMNNATLKTVDVERGLGVIINKNGKYLEQCLMAAEKANCVLGMIKRNINCKNAARIMRLYKFPWCDLDCSIAYRLGLLIIRTILRF